MLLGNSEILDVIFKIADCPDHLETSRFNTASSADATADMQILYSASHDVQQYMAMGERSS